MEVREILRGVGVVIKGVFKMGIKLLGKILNNDDTLDTKLKKARIFRIRVIGWYYLLKSLLFLILIVIIIYIIYSAFRPGYSLTINGTPLIQYLSDILKP